MGAGDSLLTRCQDRVALLSLLLERAVTMLVTGDSNYEALLTRIERLLVDNGGDMNIYNAIKAITNNGPEVSYDFEEVEWGTKTFEVEISPLAPGASMVWTDRLMNRKVGGASTVSLSPYRYGNHTVWLGFLHSAEMVYYWRE